jgi:hypothetical protein
LITQTDIVFLDREIKNRKQAFGIEIYDLMETLETNATMSTEDKEKKIRAAFDSARKDIAVIVAKKECKKEEMSVLEADGAASSNIPPSSGTVVTNSHPQGKDRIVIHVKIIGSMYEYVSDPISLSKTRFLCRCRDGPNVNKCHETARRAFSSSVFR